MDTKIRILDVTNRDGVQTSRLGLAKLEKTVLNVLLNRMGVAQSEFGFPCTRHEQNYLNANLELVRIGAINPMILSGWMRALEEDVELAVENCPRLKHINVSISTSPQMIKGKFQGKYDENDIINMMVKAVKRAKDLGIKTIGVNAEDASRTPMDYLTKFALAAKKVGADRLRYCDTLGYESPFRIHFRMKDLTKATDMPWEMHMHNDLGMAVANSIMGAKGVLEEGQNCLINTTVNSMGERAGNADLVSTVLALRHSAEIEELGMVDRRLDLSKAWKVATYASHAFGVPIPINQPGVGENAFAHESGIHADGALKDRKNYELYDYKELGRGETIMVETGRKITTGEYSGISAFVHSMKNINLKFKNNEEAREILELIRYANVHKQKPLDQEEFLFIATYPKIAHELLTMHPPEISISRKTEKEIEPLHKKKEELLYQS
ncbi:MAG: homocitrate synthase [Candidatus Lokiarchaeota archaeon]|nr:homocitrate synthase [Candidatus Lokiarchaeota archaeon]MBD3339053.1 homocitrate synthase [Candidatus Lokiarchaeota archaeon]